MHPKNKPTAYFLTGILLTIIIAATSLVYYKWYAHLVAFAGWEDIGYEHQPTWQTYRNDELGFEIQYPYGLRMSPLRISNPILEDIPIEKTLLQVSFLTPELFAFDPLHPSSTSATSIDISVVKIPSNYPINIEQSVKNFLDLMSFMIEIDKTIIAGSKATTLVAKLDDRISDRGSIRTSFTDFIIGDKLYEIRITGNLNYTQVLKTFRLLE